MGEKSWCTIRRKLGAGFLYAELEIVTFERCNENQGVWLSTARLIFINYINSPRRGQPVDWVTRIIRSSSTGRLSPLLAAKDRSVLFLPLSLSRLLKTPRREQKGGGVASFYGIVKNVKYGVSAVSWSLQAA